MERDSDRHQLAMSIINDALAAQNVGDIEKAISLYEKSLQVCPTAEGYTYLGWALSLAGKIEEAIQYCHKAIEKDPEFGNPYNDIGVYLMHRQRNDEAIPWLERAKLARRYEPKHFPYLNLGRIYAERGQLIGALREFRGAIAVLSEGGADARDVGSEIEGLELVVAQLEAKLN